MLKCPSGYTATADSCFRVVKTAMDFKVAQSTCQVDGANLASINSEYEQMSIEVLAKDVPGAIWIGLKREVYVCHFLSVCFIDWPCENFDIKFFI